MAAMISFRAEVTAVTILMVGATRSAPAFTPVPATIPLAPAITGVTFTGRNPVWHADATVPAADRSGASWHFGHGAGGPDFVNRSHDAATVFSGHHGDGLGAATAFGGSGEAIPAAPVR